MIPDVFLPAGQWVNLYAASGLSTSKRLVIVNKSATGLLVWEGNAAPVITNGDNRHGYPLQPLRDPYVTTDTTVGCWLFYPGADYGSQGRVCVQEYTP